MKHLLLIILSLVSSIVLAVPATINYQGVLTDNAGVPINGSEDITVEFFDAAIDGNSLWSESRIDVAVTDGIFFLQLGAITSLTPSLFTNNTVWLQITINGEIQSPRQYFDSVPYALSAAVANELDWSNLSNVPADLADGDNDDSANWSNISDIPADIADGDADSGGDVTSVNAGTGINVTNAGGPSPTVTHLDLSNQGSVDNSGPNVIQDITLDGLGLGHITGVGTTNLDQLYYRKSESNSLFMNSSGDTMTGDLTIARPDTEISTLRIQGSAGQGSGDLFVGQSSTFGGGISYNGDNNPVMVGAPDRIVFYRMQSGTKTAVFSYSVVSNDVSFDGYVKDENSIFNATANSNLPLIGEPTKTITFETEQLDYGSDFDIANGRYTAPVTGYYTFSASVSFEFGDGTDDTMYLSIRKNLDTNINQMNTIEINPRAHTFPGLETAYSISANILLLGGQFVTVYVSGLTSNTPVIATYRNFSGHLIRAQ